MAAPSPYAGLPSLFKERDPQNPQLGSEPIMINPTNGQEIPFFAARTLTERQAAFQAMPPHLQQQIAKLEQIEAQRTAQSMAVMRDAAYMPTLGQMPPATVAPPNPSTAQRTGDAATRAGVQRPKPTKPKFDHEFKSRRFHVRLQPSYAAIDENRIYKMRKLSKETWSRLEQIYKKYLDKIDFPDGNLRLEDMFFYKSTESEERIFQVTYNKDGLIEKKTIHVEDDDQDEIRALKDQYSLLVRNEPKKRDFKRLIYSSKGLQENLHFTPKRPGPSESPLLSMMRDEAIEKGRKQAKSYSVTIAHPLLPDEMTEGQQQALINRPIKLGQSEVNFVQESDYTEMSRSQYIFSESPHQVRAFYGVAPRSGNDPSEFNHPQIARLARLQPLHYCLNARAGALHGKQSVELQDHPSLVIFSKHETYGYRFASITQRNLLVPQMQDGEEDANCGAILHAILEQAAKYHEVRLGFRETPLKPLKIREPIIAEGIHSGSLSEEKLREIRLSVFIRSMAMLLVNSNDQIRAPKIQIEFEYTPQPGEEAVPEFILGLINQQNFLSGFILETELSGDRPNLNMAELVGLFYARLLNQFIPPEEMRERRREALRSLSTDDGSRASSRASSRRSSTTSEDDDRPVLNPSAVDDGQL